jgi:hypothetical protein
MTWQMEIATHTTKPPTAAQAARVNMTNHINLSRWFRRWSSYLVFEGRWVVYRPGLRVPRGSAWLYSVFLSKRHYSILNWAMPFSIQYLQSPHHWTQYSLYYWQRQITTKIKMCHDCVVGTATTLRSGQSRVWTPGWTMFHVLHTRPYRPWGAPSFLYNG